MNFVKYVAIAALLGISVEEVASHTLGKHHTHHKRQLVQMKQDDDDDEVEAASPVAAPVTKDPSQGALADDIDVKEWKA